MNPEERKQTIIVLNKMKCTINKKHLFTVVKLTGKKFTSQCFTCYQDLGIEHKINGSITNITDMVKK